MPTLRDIQYATLIVGLVVLPAVALTLLLPMIWSDWKLDGQALWTLQRRGMPEAQVTELLPLRTEDFSSKAAVMEAAQKALPEAVFQKHAFQISQLAQQVRRPGGEWLFLGLLVAWYGGVYALWRKWGQALGFPVDGESSSVEASSGSSS